MSGKEKLIDLLDEDKPVANQKFVCVSISPENILKQKTNYLFEAFIKNWDYKHHMQKFTEFMNFIAFKYNVNFDKMVADFEEFAKLKVKNLPIPQLMMIIKLFLITTKNDLLNNLRKTIRSRQVYVV